MKSFVNTCRGFSNFLLSFSAIECVDYMSRYVKFYRLLKKTSWESWLFSTLPFHQYFILETTMILWIRVSYILFMLFNESLFGAYFQCLHGDPQLYLNLLTNPKVISPLHLNSRLTLIALLFPLIIACSHAVLMEKYQFEIALRICLW